MLPKKYLGGLRVVAVIEGLKGLLVLVAGLGLIALVHRDAQQEAEALILQMHLNPAHHYPRIFIEAASHLNNAHLILFAAGAFLYALVRFVEGYGLWRDRLWAEWFAVIAGSVYLPFEIFELWRGVTAVKVVIFALNLLVVAYLALALWQSKTKSNGSQVPRLAGRASSPDDSQASLSRRADPQFRSRL
jgi:uncharacterized membrane protein (DUF2068 family)